METIAFYGAGMLGSGFVRTLCRNGHTVHVWNRTAQKAEALADCGAIAFTDAAACAQGASRIHLCLADDLAVDSTLDAMRGGLAKNATIIDHTTVSIAGVLAREVRLCKAGYEFLHAPVFMGPPQAHDGTGTMLVSGDQSRIARLQAALSEMTGTLRNVGPRVDAAAIYKLMGNAMILAVIGGLADVLSISREHAFTPEQAFALFDFYDPSGQIAGRGKRMFFDDRLVTWTLEMARKDARLMQAAAAHPLPVIDAVTTLLSRGIEQHLGSQDLAAVARIR